MGSDEHEPKTMADAIRAHVDCQRASDRLLAEQVENNRAMAEVYRMIKYALSKPELNQVAVVDEETGRVYILCPDGVVRDFVVKSASDVAMGGGDEIVSIGEAS